MQVHKNEKAEFTPLSELLEIANKFTNGEITDKELEEYGQNMQIRQYIPLMEKVNLAMAILTGYLYSDTELYEIKIGELYKNIFFYGLLQSYAFIDCEDTNLITYANYDLLYPLFGEFLLQFCKTDYDFLVGIIHDCINMYSIKDITNSVAMFSADELKEAIESNKVLIDNLDKNKGLIGELGRIAEMNDPFTAKVVNELKQIKNKK